MIYYNKLAHEIMKADKSQELQGKNGKLEIQKSQWYMFVPI